MTEVGILDVTDPQSDPLSFEILKVTHDEPVNGTGDGDTSPDAAVQNNRVFLRSERDGGSNGRVYEITFIATDPGGAACSGSVKVSVPPNNRPGSNAVDDGQLFDSTGR